jgi:hypothetical protein
LDKIKSLKRELKSFLLQHAFYSLDEFVAYWLHMACRVWELYKLSSLSVLISIGTLHYIILYYMLLF